MHFTSPRFALLIISIAMLMSFVIIALGSSPNDITFPVAELGGCQTKALCQAYCEQPRNYKTCNDFARKHNLLPKDKLEQNEKFAELMRQGGPGGCSSRVECEGYCEDLSHMDECLAFAERHDIVPSEELDEMRKVAKAVRAGKQLPGGCKNKNECEAYCSQPDNMEACMEFALEAGFMSSEEAREARKMIEFMRRGEMPGNCRSKEQCEAYCSDGNHFEECVLFAEKAGMISPEDAAMARKTGGKGPGDCRGREECEAFCNNPENMQTCFEFAKAHGLMSEDDERRMQEGMEQMQRGLEQAPPEVRLCIEQVMGPETIAKIKNREFMPGPEIGEKMHTCFQQMESVMREKMQREFQQNMPPEVLACLKLKLGERAIDRITSGEIPREELEPQIQSCFQENTQGPTQDGMMRESGTQQGMQGAPPELQACIDQSLEAMTRASSSNQPPAQTEVEALVRRCIEELGLQVPVREGFYPQGYPHPEGEMMPPMMPPQTFPSDDGFASEFPPEALTCMKKLYGEDVLEQMRIGQFQPPPDMGERIKTCVMEQYGQFQPSPQ